MKPSQLFWRPRCDDRVADENVKMRRALIFVCVITIHVMLASLFTNRAVHTRKSAADPVMTVRAVAAPPPSQLVSRDLPIDAHVTAPDFQVLPPADDAAALCAVLDKLDTALSHDPAVQPALTAVMAEPARAVMIWDGHWSAAAGMQVVRRVVAATISVQPVACRNEIQVGPRLIFVSVPDTTISIVVGSGTWRWNDLLSSG